MCRAFDLDFVLVIDFFQYFNFHLNSLSLKWFLSVIWSGFSAFDVAAFGAF
jgi:hypothetical protein